MKRANIAVLCAFIAALFSVSTVLAANGDNSGNVTIPSQQEIVPPAAGSQNSHQRSTSAEPAIPANPQPGVGNDDRALEIAPQPNPAPPKQNLTEIPEDKRYQPSEKDESLAKNYVPDELNDQNFWQNRAKRRLPYFGVSVQYKLVCYLGREEHGLEIIKIDPNSPAAQAGLKGYGKMSAGGAAAATASGLLGPLSLAVMPFLNRAGALGSSGDVIVAVDDHRVRTERDLERELARLKPGDTMYVTVLRPQPGGQHKTMKLAVKVGELQSPDQQAKSDTETLDDITNFNY